MLVSSGKRLGWLLERALWGGTGAFLLVFSITVSSLKLIK